MNLSKKNNDKFICYCKKITKNDFVDFLKLNKTNNFNTACNEIGAASECSACLANLEDAYISIRSNLGENKNIKYKSNISFLKKIINKWKRNIEKSFKEQSLKFFPVLLLEIK